MYSNWQRLVAFVAFMIPHIVWADGFSPIEPAPVERALPVMINLSALADWNTQQPFLDRMKAARGWVGHLPRSWGGVDHEDLAERGVLDDAGWPREIPDDLTSIGTLLMTDLPEQARTLAGRYVLRFDGTGIVEVAGRAKNVRYGSNRVSFDFEPGPGFVEVKIQRSDRRGTGDYVRNITIIREDQLDLYESGAVFNPDFLATLRGFSGLRFMDWMQTNNSEISDWSERPKPNDYTYTRIGVPFEVMADLANTIGADAWVTLPHLANDTYFRNAAEMMKSELDPDRRTYVEFSNEVWNWQFFQTAWAGDIAEQRWGAQDQWQQAYGMRAAQMARIWREVYADASHRMVAVLSTHATWLGLEDQVLNAQSWQDEDASNPAPFTLFDAYAITGYMYGGLGREDTADMVRNWLAESWKRADSAGRAQGLTGDALRDYIEAHRYDHAFTLAAHEVLNGAVSGQPEGTIAYLSDRIFSHHSQVAADHDLQMIMYEGGTHIVGLGPVQEDPELSAFFQAFNYSSEMGTLYSHLMSEWAKVTDGPFNQYTDVSQSSKWGSWGSQRYYGDDNPRWQTIRAFRDGPGG